MLLGSQTLGKPSGAAPVFDGVHFVAATIDVPPDTGTGVAWFTESGTPDRVQHLSNEVGTVGLAHNSAGTVLGYSVGNGVRLYDVSNLGNAPIDVGETSTSGPPQSARDRVPMVGHGTKLSIVLPTAKELITIEGMGTTTANIETAVPIDTLDFASTLSVTAGQNLLVTSRSEANHRVAGWFQPSQLTPILKLISREAVASTVSGIAVNANQALVSWSGYVGTPSRRKPLGTAFSGSAIDATFEHGHGAWQIVATAPDGNNWLRISALEDVEPWDILAAVRIGADGVAMGPRTTPATSVYPYSIAIAQQTSGHVVCVAGDDLDGENVPVVAIYLVDSAGEWTSLGRIGRPQFLARCVANGAGRTLVAWHESSGPVSSIWGAIVEAGTVEQPFKIQESTNDLRAPTVASFDGDWFVAWLENLNGASFVFGRRILADGTIVGDTVQLTTVTAADDPILSDLKDGNHVALLWSGSASGGAADIYASLLDAEMNVVNSAPVLLVPGELGATNPHLVTYDVGNSLLAYDRIRPEVRAAQTYARAVSITFPDGDACSDDVDCGSGHCIDGICCGEACGTCETCMADGSVCEKQVDVAVDDCNGDLRCSGNGECLPVDGANCGTDGECASGFCVDGTCCNRACEGSCEQCGNGTCETLECDGFGCQTNEQGRICRETCSDSSQCETGYQCTAGGACVAINAASSDPEDGCGCLLVGRRRRSSRWAWLAIGLGLAATCARRRRLDIHAD